MTGSSVAPVTAKQATPGTDPPKGEEGPPPLRVGSICSGLLSETDFDHESEHEDRLPIEIVLAVENNPALLQRIKETRAGRFSISPTRACALSSSSTIARTSPATAHHPTIGG